MKQDKIEFKALVDLLSDIFDIEEKEVEKYLVDYGISSLAQFYIALNDFIVEVAHDAGLGSSIKMIRTEALLDLLEDIFSLTSEQVSDFMTHYGILSFNEFERDLENRIKRLSN